MKCHFCGHEVDRPSAFGTDVCIPCGVYKPIQAETHRSERRRSSAMDARLSELERRVDALEKTS